MNIMYISYSHKSRNAFGRQPVDGLPALMMADQRITKQKATAPGKVQRWHQSKKER